MYIPDIFQLLQLLHLCIEAIFANVAVLLKLDKSAFSSTVSINNWRLKQV